MRSTILFLGFLLGLGMCSDPVPQTEQAPVQPAFPGNSVRARVEQEIKALNALRSGLAQTIGEEPVDQTTFARVCKPVGMRARQLATDNGWIVQQLADRYRNPDHQLDDEARRVFRQFAEDSTLADLWIASVRAGQPGTRYFRRITVERACLACHGDRDERPGFVKENYPEDRAYGFEVGDLRGLYAVFVPDTTRSTP